MTRMRRTVPGKDRLTTMRSSERPTALPGAPFRRPTDLPGAGRQVVSRAGIASVSIGRQSGSGATPDEAQR